MLAFNSILLLDMVGLCFFSLLVGKRKDQRLSSILDHKKIYYSVIIILFIIAIGVRAYKFGQVPSGFNQDGAMAGVDALALSKYGTDRFGMSFPVYFTAWGYGQMSVLLSYLMIPFIKLFGLTPVTARLPILLLSIVGIIVQFELIKKIFNKQIAVVVLAFVAINPWHIMQSRWALDCNVFPHFLLISIFLLYLGLEKKLYLYISMIFFALTMYTYGVAFYSVPILLLIVCIFLLREKAVSLKSVLLCGLTYFIFSWPIYAVIVINSFRLNTLKIGVLTIPFFPDSVRMNDILIFSHNGFISQLFSNIKSLINVGFLQKGDLPWNSMPEYGALYLFTLPFFIMGMVYIYNMRRNQQNENANVKIGRFLILAWLSVAVFSGIFINGVNINRVNIIFYPLCMITGIGIYHVLFESINMKTLAVLVAVIFSVSFIGFNINYFGENSKVLAKSFYDGFYSALEKAEESNTDVIYITSYTQGNDTGYVSEILTMFGSSIDAKYFQGKGDMYGTYGTKKLPYKERYKYVNYNAFSNLKEKNAAYLFNRAEGDIFSQDEYEITNFGWYGVAIPK